jgi:hypothetical protein
MPRLTGNRCQCPTCGEYFNGVQPFDKHRTGDYAKPGQPNTRRCLTVAEMIAAGFIRIAAGFWMSDSRGQRAARQSAAGLPAHRTHGAMVTRRVGTGAPETLTGATP